MKGKKFDAHEKHFKAKEDKLNKRIKFLERRYQEVCKESLYYSMENEELIKENTDIKVKYERLLEYSKLTDIEIKEALKRDKSVNQLAVALNVINTISKY